MRILHTSDWHAGRVWKSVDRLGELGTVLGNLASTIERERIDLVLVTGDVFDHGAPPAEAERVVFEFFKRIGRAGIPSIVIAGNHDSPVRIEAWGTLAELVHVHTRGLPRPPAKGGVIELTTSGGEDVIIAAVPFAPVVRMLSALDLAEGDTHARQRYATTMQAMLERLTAWFRADAVNLVMAHTHLDGAVIGGSERTVHVGSEWAATPQMIPATAHYVALGHIHRPQQVAAAPSPTYYAGSPLQLDFGEAGQEKTFNVIEVRPGLPARVDLVPYEGGVPLATVSGTLAELEASAAQWRGAGYLKVTVRLQGPDLEINRKVRALLPNAISVDVELPARDLGGTGERPPADAAPVKLYEAFHRERHQEPATEPVLRAFEDLYAAVSKE